MDNNEKQVFNYTYSADEQNEIKRIREKYAPTEIDKMEQLRQLDRGVTGKATMHSVIVGTLAALVLGIGMSCAMVWQGMMFVPGIVIGAVGICGVAAAYPLYNRILKKEREKIAPEVIRLTDELMK